MNYTTEETFKTSNGLQVKAFKVNSDVCGNPRWVVHFLDLLTSDEQKEVNSEVTELRKRYPNTWVSCTEHLFNAALQKARKVGGRKYRAKWFGGALSFNPMTSSMILS